MQICTGSQAMSVEEIYNYVKVDDRISTSGQPTEEQLKALSAEGVTNVINLAPTTSRNALADEAGVVQSLGMTYCYIPVAWDNPTESDFATFEKAMEQADTGKTLIHCAANFRVTAFYSLYAQKHLGWTEEQADQFRARIWTGSDFPVWEEFVRKMKTQLKTE